MAANNDMSGQYLSARQTADEKASPYKQLMAEQAPEPVQAVRRNDPVEFNPPPVSVVDKTVAVASDISGGVIESPRQIFGGIRDAVQETLNAADSIEESLVNFLGAENIPMILQFQDENGDFNLDLLSRSEVADKGGLKEILPIVSEPRTGTGSLVRGVSQFLTGFLGAGKVLKPIAAAGKTAKTAKVMAQGAMADAIVFDPHEARLSNLTQEFPLLENPVSEYLAAQPGDTEAEGRFKNALEGLFLGGLTESMFHAVRGIRANNIAKNEAKQVAADKATAERVLGTEPQGQTLTDQVNADLNVQADEIAAREAGAKVVEPAKAGKIHTIDKLITTSDGMTRGLDATATANNLPPVADGFTRLYKGVSDTVKFEDVFDAQYLEDFMPPASLKGHFYSDDLDYANYFRHALNEDGLARIDYVDVPADMAAKTKHQDGFIIGDKELKLLESEAKPPKAAGAKANTEPTPIAEPALPSLGDPTKPAFSGGAGKAEDEAALNINLSRLNTTEDVDKLIQGVAEAEPQKINEARREIITNEETTKLADELGMSVDSLLNRRKGESFNAEQAVAARKILVSSAENLIEMAKKAATGTDEEVASFRRAMSQHSAIQAQVSGLTAEAGRALQSFNIQAGSSAISTRAINEALKSGGGRDVSQGMAGQIAQLADTAQVNKTVDNMLGAKTTDMIFEAWINGLLSSPATHAVNVLSNAIVTAWSVGERKVASMMGQAHGGQSIPEGEVAAQYKGMVEGAKDGMRLAWHVLKTGEPADQMTKLETQQFRSITAENLNLSGTAGRFADYVGEVVRLPGRFLTAGDELFKTTGYRMELNAQAYRTAYNEGLRGQELATRMSDIVMNPPDNLHIQAQDVSRYQTFTKPLGEGGQAFQQAVHRNPGLRVIVPFIRTPTNIIKFVGERTPLAPLSTSVRQEIAAGGARRDLAMAKIATGSMVMAAAADYTLSGQITGSGPKNPQMRNILRATGWQPYSIKVNDNYYAYSRLDPIGALLGISADITEIIGQTSEADALDLTTAAVVSVAQNVTSKTYLRGLSEAFDLLSSTSSDPGANNRKAVRWIERMAGTVIPSGVAQVARTLDPGLRATQGILEKIQSRTPGYSDSLPPRRNIFGEPIVLSGGLGPDIMSPIYISTDKHDPVANEIVAQQTLIRMPRNVVSGVELDSILYDKYIRLYSGEDNKHVKMPLKDQLSELFNNPHYQKGSDGQEGSKSVFIRAVFERYRESAKAILIEENPELEMSIVKLKTTKIDKLRGVQ